MNTFTPSFKQAADRVAEGLGLQNYTNSRHEKNGTIAYRDPVTGCIYTLHSNGYIRRTTVWVNHRGYSWRQCYQLNRTEKGEYVSPYTGDVYPTTNRVMMSPWEQLGKLASSTISFRKARWQQN